MTNSLFGMNGHSAGLTLEEIFSRASASQFTGSQQESDPLLHSLSFVRRLRCMFSAGHPVTQLVPGLGFEFAHVINRGLTIDTFLCVILFFYIVLVKKRGMPTLRSGARQNWSASPSSAGKAVAAGKLLVFYSILYVVFRSNWCGVIKRFSVTWYEITGMK